MPDPTALPIQLARLVQAQRDVDIRSELAALFESGRRTATIGIGLNVDVPLLDRELHAAEIASLDREVVIAAVRVESDGYLLERGWSNFGVYVWTELDPLWVSVPWMGTVRGLRPGDKVAMGSTPADALQFTLPESAAVPPRLFRRSPRQEEADAERRAATPPPAATPLAPGRTPGISGRTLGPKDPWEGVTPNPKFATPMSAAASRRPMPLRVDSDRFQPAFDVAIKHWRYAMITFGGDDRSVVPLDDPELAPLRAALVRNLEQPERGYELFVRDPTPELWVQQRGAGAQILQKGAVIKLTGPGNRFGFAGYVVHLPEPAGPIPRFGPRTPPTELEIAAVLGLREHEVHNPDRVKLAYREQVVRFHPDKHGGEPGHLSRYLELQACMEALKATREEPGTDP
ncbi:MAG: J domain-containing protein [Myxococcota bacterium]